MKHIVLAATAIALFVASPSYAQNFKRVTKEADFRAIFVGKNLSFPGGTAVIHANGKTDGKLDKKGKYHGVWAWQKRFYCRNLVIGGKETGTNCQKIEIDGNTARFTRDQGKGRVSVITIN
ncbi:hypothetical protein [Planktotalea sp.]|uniref:hypothetical protein n=1 Tax=Planktotalea sp. TaxID=2029877 RepID=UPI003D6BD603